MNYDEEKHRQVVMSWYEADKKDKLRLNYPLNESSIVFDVGAYVGDWGLQIFRKYNCIVHCFEPVDDAFKKLEHLANRYPRMQAHKYAIGGSTRNDKIYLNKDGSSAFGQTPHTQDIEVKSILDVMSELGVNKVSLLKMNVEGMEFEILESIIEHDCFDLFDHIQVQFHRDVPEHREKRDKIRKKLEETHHETYNFEFVWESWSRNIGA